MGNTFLEAAAASLCASLLGSAGMLALATPAAAGLVTITISNDGDPVQAESDDVTIVDDTTGATLVFISLTEPDEVSGGLRGARIPNRHWTTPETVFIDEPAPTPSISDIFTLLNRGNDAYVYFTSDDNLDTIPIVNPQSHITEVGPGTIGPFPSLLVPAPEPMTLSVLGAGLAGLAGLRRRRKAA